MLQLKSYIQESFEHIRKALSIREKLIQRQLDLLSQKISIDKVKFSTENKNEVLEEIRSFGKFNLDHYAILNDVFTTDDYICPSNDHDFMYKKLEEQNGVKDNEIIVDFSNNKSLIKENANFLNESIINITINESKQLIEKSTNNLDVVKHQGRVFSGTDFINRRQTDENKLEKLIKQTKPLVDTQKPDSIPIKKEKVTLNKSMKNISNLTINNCTGTLNFKNISNLTINSCKGVNALDSPKTEEYECGFYNRLISENKLLNSIPTGPPSSISSSDSSRKIISKDIEFKNNNKLNYIPNCKSMNNMLNNNCNDFDDENYENNHPIQVQQWLKQIYYEAETEPVQNIEILEHSNIDIN